jgi:hypothetical protein
MEDDILLDKYDDFRIIYLDIIRGYSYSDRLKCYVKHLSDFDMSVLTVKKKVFEDKERADGLLSERDKLKEVISQDEWSEKKEDDIASLKLIIADNTKLIENMSVPEQRKTIQGIVDGKKEELREMELERTSLLYPNLETASFEYYLEILPQYCLFKDTEMKVPLHSAEEYEETLSEEDMSNINNCYLETVNIFSERNMRAISVMPFVINQLSYCKKSVLSFLNKPVISFTSHQMDIYSRAMRNLSILESAEGEPPEIESITTVQEVLDWYDLNYSIIQGKHKGKESDAVRTSKTYQTR